MRRIKIVVSYDGTDYHGWQVQPGLPTIQGALEQVISGIEGRPVQVAGSGRTDAGVHALAQVAAFSIENPIPVDNLRRAMNRLLPRDIRVLTWKKLRPTFIRASRPGAKPTNIAFSAARSVRRLSAAMSAIIRIRWRSKT